MYGMDKKGCDFCGFNIFNKDGHGHGPEDCEWKKCHEEERCFEKTFECREKKIIECREKKY